MKATVPKTSQDRSGSDQVKAYLGLAMLYLSLMAWYVFAGLWYLFPIPTLGIVWVALMVGAGFHRIGSGQVTGEPQPERTE